MNINKNFGMFLKRMQSDLGKKNIILAEKFKVKSASISQWRKSVSIPNSKNKIKIATFFHNEFIKSHVNINEYLDKYIEDFKKYIDEEELCKIIHEKNKGKYYKCLLLLIESLCKESKQIEQNNIYLKSNRYKKLKNILLYKINFFVMVCFIVIVITFILIFINQQSGTQLSNEYTINTISITKTPKGSINKGKNLIKNYGFENNIESWRGDLLRGIVKNPKVDVLIEDNISYQGENSLKIETKGNNDHAHVLQYIDLQKLEKGEKYKITSYIKTNNVGSNDNSTGACILLNIYPISKTKKMSQISTTPVKGTTNWKISSTEFILTEDIGEIKLFCCLYSRYGLAYFDNIVLKKIEIR